MYWLREVLEGLTVGRGRRAIQDLLDFLPRTVLVRRNGQEAQVAADQVRAGDTVIVKPGGHIPVDGSVLAGHSFVEQAAITGEALPVEKVAGDFVYAGTINQSGALEIAAEKLGRDTTFGRIINAVERAEKVARAHSKDGGPAGRLSGVLRSGGGGIDIAHHAQRSLHHFRGHRGGRVRHRGGNPLAILGAIGRAAHQGAIVKGGLHLEALAVINTVLLDKTGTLTFGSPQIQEVVPSDGFSVLKTIAAADVAERRSEHPLGKAITAHARGLGIAAEEPEEFSYTPGMGIRAALKGEEILVGNRALLDAHAVRFTPPSNGAAGGVSQVYVARGGAYLGTIRIADVLRPEARQAVAAMRRMGLRTVLLSGDAQAVTTWVGRDLGVDEMLGDLLPEEKAHCVSQLRLQGRRVAMVGDGINDAPALAQANVGIAMGIRNRRCAGNCGRCLDRERPFKIRADPEDRAALPAHHHAKFCWHAGGRHCGRGHGRVRFLNPLLAATIHVVSELAFILNSTRLLPRSSRAGK